MKTRLVSILSVIVSMILLLPLMSCGGSEGPSASKEVKLEGAGSTFANPIYQKWFSLYMPQHSNVKLDYQSIGSGGGIKAIQGHTVDFAGTDAPLNEEQMKQSPGMLHIPTVLGGVVLTYNIPSIGSTTLKFSGDTLAGMYLGDIKKWNDPKIAADNPGVKLPDADITTVHRSDGSGTTYCFVDYLSKVSPEWASKVGKGTSVSWPAGGIGSKGSEGVTGSVKQTPNSIGYVELIYAMQNNLSYADIKNAEGEWVKATLDSVTTAAAGAANNMPEDLRVSITNAPGKGVYPISTFTWILVYKDQTDETKGAALAQFLWWGIHDGQQAASGLGYAPLPSQVVQKDEEKIKAMQFNGKPVYTPTT